MSKPKENDEPIKVTKVNPVNKDQDEVFYYREDPYVNGGIYVKKDKYKVGDVLKEEG